MGATIVVNFQIKPGMRDQLAEFLESKAYPSAKLADGFEGITMYTVDEDSDRLVEIEQWSSSEAYDAWLQPTLADLGAELMAMLAAPPEVLHVREIASG